jgi:uncharacterized membrane protein
MKLINIRLVLQAIWDGVKWLPITIGVVALIFSEIYALRHFGYVATAIIFGLIVLITVIVVRYVQLYDEDKMGKEKMMDVLKR